MSTTTSPGRANPISTTRSESRHGRSRLTSLLFAGTSAGAATDVALLLARVIVGVVFIAHGGQKLFGLWGGEGIAGTGAMFEQSGLTPGEPLAVLAGAGEFFGGILLVLGLLTRLGAFAIATSMVVAIVAIHLPGPLLNGFEFPLSLLGIALVFLTLGAGRLSLDAIVRARMTRTADPSREAHNAPR